MCSSEGTHVVLDLVQQEIIDLLPPHHLDPPPEHLLVSTLSHRKFRGLLLRDYGKLVNERTLENVRDGLLCHGNTAPTCIGRQHVVLVLTADIWPQAHYYDDWPLNLEL